MSLKYNNAEIFEIENKTIKSIINNQIYNKYFIIPFRFKCQNFKYTTMKNAQILTTNRSI